MSHHQTPRNSRESDEAQRRPRLPIETERPLHSRHPVPSRPERHPPMAVPISASERLIQHMLQSVEVILVFYFLC